MNVKYAKEHDQWERSSVDLWITVLFLRGLLMKIKKAKFHSRPLLRKQRDVLYTEIAWHSFSVQKWPCLWLKFLSLQAKGFHGEIEDLQQWLTDTERHLLASKPLGGLPETAREQLNAHMVCSLLTIALSSD